MFRLADRRPYDHQRCVVHIEDEKIEDEAVYGGGMWIFDREYDGNRFWEAEPEDLWQPVEDVRG